MAFEPINTQEDLDKILTSRVTRAEKAVREEMQKTIDSLTADKEQLAKDLEDMTKKHDDVSQKFADEQKTVKSLTLKDMRRTAAIEANLDLSFADRLKGETAEELKADAVTLAQAFSSTKTTPPLADPESGTGTSAYAELLGGLDL